MNDRRERTEQERERARLEREARRAAPRAARARRARAAASQAPRAPGSAGYGRRRAGAIAALLGVAFAIWLLFALFQPFKGGGEGRVVVAIPRGAGAGEIADLLDERGVVSSGFLFSVRATIGGRRGDLKPGTYTLARDMSYGAAIAVLAKGPPPPRVVRVTIPEGRSRRETVPIVQQAGLAGDYLAATRRSPRLDPRDFGAPRGTDSLEGFLFPATYELRTGTPVAHLVEQQLAAFKQRFATLDLRRARRGNLTRYDVLVIASMIEREAQVARERPLIAAVIYNRLKARMPLGIDATIRYATNNWTRPLRQSELRSDSPYNTRTRRGLPPTPIGNPGLASLKAAAGPARVPYLYYVVKPGTCGEHAFSTNAAQFERDVARYNSERARRGGKSPTDCP